MPRFAANLTMLFNEVDFLDRFEAAASAAGFKGVEYLFPYDYNADQLAELLSKHGLTQVLHNLPAGDWDGGDRGIACDPDRVGRVPGRRWDRDRVRDRAWLPAGELSRRGSSEKRRTLRSAHDTFVQNLKFAARRFGVGRHPPADRADQHD